MPDIEIFADAACTTKPTGEVSEVYARVNKPWGINESWMVGGDITCTGPNDEFPEDPYQIIWDVDFYSDSSDYPFSAGGVVVCRSSDAYDVTGVPTEFFKP